MQVNLPSDFIAIVDRHDFNWTEVARVLSNDGYPVHRDTVRKRYYKEVQNIEGAGGFVQDAKLLEFCKSKDQRNVIKAMMEHRDFSQVSEATGLAVKRCKKLYQTVKKLAVRQGYSPLHDQRFYAPDGQILKGVSTFYDGDGKVSRQWVKTDVDKDRQIEILTSVCRDIASSVPALDKVSKPKYPENDLLNVYTMTDCHLGMYAWAPETGESWDMDIAENVLTKCFAGMVHQSPQAESCVVAQLGDFLHFDGLDAVTPTSGHILDAAGRFPEIVKAAVRILRNLIAMALQKHKTVYVLMAEGNHDMASSVWLRVLFSALFEKNPRVIMIESENPYYAMEWGQTMLAWHHGHKKTPEKIALFMATLYPQIWGQSQYRYTHLGDKHHFKAFEDTGMYIEQHPTLAGADAYATRGGWRSNQKSTAITYSKQYGEVGRVSVTPAMVST